MKRGLISRPAGWLEKTRLNIKVVASIVTLVVTTCGVIGGAFVAMKVNMCTHFGAVAGVSSYCSRPDADASSAASRTPSSPDACPFTDSAKLITLAQKYFDKYSF